MQTDTDQPKPSILIVHNYYQIGGGEHTVFENEKELLEENGHRVYGYTRNNHEIDRSWITKGLLPFTTVFSFKTYREAVRLIRANRIDIVHCHNTFPLISPSVYYAAKTCGVPVVQTIHNFRFLCPNGIFFRNGRPCEECIERGLCRSVGHGCYRASRIQTAVVAAMLRVHRILGTYKIPNYIFLTEFNKSKFVKLPCFSNMRSFIKPNSESISETPVSNTQIRRNEYVYIGRLEANKGLRFLLQAWRETSNAELFIFGAGDLKQEVIKAASDNHHIHYEGFQEKAIILDRLKKAQALLFPSLLYEGFPMTIIESFAVGTPVLCANIGNQGAIVSAAQGGLTYRVNDPRDFLDQMSAIDAQRDVLSANARRTYETKFAPKENYAMLMTIYRSVKENEHE